MAQREYVDPKFIEVSVFDDGSEDGSLATVRSWKERFEELEFSFALSGQKESRGCGFARNRAASQSHGRYLCFLDSYDIMRQERCAAQLSECWEQPSEQVQDCHQLLLKNIHYMDGWMNEIMSSVMV